MARLGQDAPSGERPRVPTPKPIRLPLSEVAPDEAGAAVGTGGRVIGVNEPGERDAVLLLDGGQGVGVAEQARLEVTLWEAISKQPLENRADALLGRGPEALADDFGESAQAVIGHGLFGG